MGLFSFITKKSQNLTAQAIDSAEQTRPAIVGILLAAGRGSRFDPSGKQSKLTQAIDGVPVLAMAISALCEVLDHVIVIIRDDRHRHELEQLIDMFGAKAVVCPDATSGMGHSLAWGVGYVNTHYSCGGVVIALGDMPYIDARSVASLVTHIRKPSDIAALRFEGRMGHPVGFGSDHFASLGKLTGDQGAKKIIQDHKAIMIDTRDSGVLRDLDTPSDFHPGKS